MMSHLLGKLRPANVVVRLGKPQEADEAVLVLLVKCCKLTALVMKHLDASVNSNGELL
jgi:hypothetical protein